VLLFYGFCKGGLEKPMNNSIEFKQFHFRLTAKEPLIHPSYKGSTLWGGFIYVFRRVDCAIRDKKCVLDRSKRRH